MSLKTGVTSVLTTFLVFMDPYILATRICLKSNTNFLLIANLTLSSLAKVMDVLRLAHCPGKSNILYLISDLCRDEISNSSTYCFSNIPSSEMPGMRINLGNLISLSRRNEDSRDTFLSSPNADI